MSGAAVATADSSGTAAVLDIRVLIFVFHSNEQVRWLVWHDWSGQLNEVEIDLAGV
jgi:hypothetical protein